MIEQVGRYRIRQTAAAEVGFRNGASERLAASKQVEYSRLWSGLGSYAFAFAFAIRAGCSICASRTASAKSRASVNPVP